MGASSNGRKCQDQGSLPFPALGCWLHVCVCRNGDVRYHGLCGGQQRLIGYRGREDPSIDGDDWNGGVQVVRRTCRVSCLRATTNRKSEAPRPSDKRKRDVFRPKMGQAEIDPKECVHNAKLSRTMRKSASQLDACLCLSL